MSAAMSTQRLTAAPPSPESFTPPGPAPPRTDFIKRHPVLAFCVLAFAISWGGILLVIGGPGNFPGSTSQVEKLFLFVMLAWLARPSVASIVVTGFVDGSAGYRELLAALAQVAGGRALVRPGAPCCPAHVCSASVCALADLR